MEHSERFSLCLTCILCLTVQFSLSSEKCILQNTTDSSKVELLDSISLLNGIKYLTANNDFSYAVSICSDVSKGFHPNASVTRTHIAHNTTTVLGRYNETDIISIKKGHHQILLTYSGGDVMNESAICNNTKWKTLLFISCSHDADDINIDLLDPLNGGCFAIFYLKTSVSCPPKQSLFLRWFLLTILGVSMYFLCGIFYKRYVEGAKGWEQVPHHEFWRNPLQHLMGCLRGKDEIQIPRNAGLSPNDTADEPLLRP